MNSLRSKTFLKPGFALISVLALVSLAALTATAFLASARLERMATRSIGDTTRLNMALNVGMESATKSLKFIVGDPPRPWNFVTTYWRTNSADEVGYLFVGKAVASTSLNWAYVCGFSPSSWTNLSGDLMSSNIIFTNTNCQGSFSNDASTFMSTKGALNFNPDPPKSDLKCTRIDMIGGRKSPPVGWVYIKQDIRTNPSSTNTANLPVVRFAYFTEDLSGLIDADRMGGSLTRSAATGTNAEEISLTNLTGVTYSGLSYYTNNRPQYLTPGMLLFANGGFLNNTNDLRYFASRLPKCLWTTNYTNYDRIPYVPISSNPPIYPTNAGYLKLVLNNLNAGGQSIIAARITNNFPMFTNRAGGMNANLYVNALAANIVDYADADSLATVVNVGGVNAVGYDSYPLLTHVYDRFVCTANGSNAPTIGITTFLQFWNLASSNAPTAIQTINYNLNDRIHSVVFQIGTNSSTNTNSSPLLAAIWTTNLTIPNMPSNSVYITNITRTISIPNTSTNPGYPWSSFSKVWINSNNSGPVPIANVSNSIAVTIGTATNMKLRSGYFRNGFSLTNTETVFSGVVLGLKGQGPTAPGVSGQSKLLADPRMNNYITLTNGVGSYSNTFWGAYPTETNFVSPLIWPDGTSSNILSSAGVQYTGNTSPVLGLTNLLDPAACKISNRGFYTNICELGHIFDPIQWRPPAPPAATNYANTNVSSTWAADSLYGGGSTLRIGRPEHSRFAFTNLGGTYPVPSLGTSAAGLLDIFCTTNVYNWAGKININTAPLSVLAALAGGISLNTTNYSGTAPVNGDMIRAFTNGVVKFRQTYPFITPSQLAFISTDYGTTSPHWTNTWPTNAVFSTNPSGGLQGPTAINDEGREEWFSKIYNLTCVQSFNYRIYVVAQLTDTNGNPKGAAMRKYYDLYLNNNTPNAGANTDLNTPSISPIILSETAY
jgi:hypothetical protein